MRLVVDTVRRKPVAEALYRLKISNKKAALLVEKAIRSAAANAKVLKMDEERLYVSQIKADGGPVFKRFMSRSMGRADRILKRTSHLTVILEEGKQRMKPYTPLQEREEAEKPKRKLIGRKKKAAGSKAESQ